MKFSYSFDERNIELTAAVKVLQGMTEDAISMSSMITVETECEDLAKVLGVMIPQSRFEKMINEAVNGWQPPVSGVDAGGPQGDSTAHFRIFSVNTPPRYGKMEAARAAQIAEDPSSRPEEKPGKSAKQALEMKHCKICGELFTPKRVDQFLCWNPDCRKKQAKIWADEHKKKAEQAAPAVIMQEGLEGTSPLSLENHNGHNPQE